MLVSLILAAVAVALYYWLALPRLRRLPRWNAAVFEARAVLERAGARLRPPPPAAATRPRRR